MLPKRQLKMTAALAMAFIMIAIPVFSQLSTDTEEVDAADVNAETYYYDQLSNAGKEIYNAVLANDMAPGRYNVSIVTSDVSSDWNQAISALNTEKMVEFDWSDFVTTYWYNESSHTINSYQIDVANGYTDVSQKISSIKSTINGYIPSDSSTRFTTVKSIHDHLAGLLRYDDDMSGTYIRSIYGSLEYDHSVVCEGYARTFKALCDANDVPCIIVRGYAGTSTMESHMYNYVQMEDGNWYLVDVTWDDQTSGIQYNYMLAGTSSKGFNNTIVAYSHDFTITESTGFTVPTLSTTGYTFGCTISFDTLGGSTVASMIQNYGTSVTEPTEPTRSGYTFVGWYTDEECTQIWNSATPITSNMTVYAGWEEFEESSGSVSMTYIIIGIIALLIVVAIIAVVVKKGKSKV